MAEPPDGDDVKWAALVTVGMERRRELSAAAALESARECTADAVDRARRFGATWEEVADTLGMSRQAAHRRFDGEHGGGDGG